MIRMQVLSILHMYKYITVIVQHFIKGWNFVALVNRKKSNIMKYCYRKKHIYKGALNYSKGNIKSFEFLFFSFFYQF